MSELSFVTLDVFTRTRFRGNPLAVVLIPEHKELSTEQMQTIAVEFNLSETLFMYARNPSSSIPEWRVRIFTTNEEVPFAGHPTIGAACYALGNLAKGAKEGRLICNSGPIELQYTDGVARASIPHNFHRHVEAAFTLEEVYALQPNLKELQIQPIAVDLISPVKGMNFVGVELPSLDALEQVRTSGVSARPQLDEGWRVGFTGSSWYVVLDINATGEKANVRTRMIEGLLEDPATGSAACALAVFLAMKWRKAKVVEIEITQGVEMGRQSEIGVVVTLGQGLDVVEKVELSGSAVEVMQGNGHFLDDS